MAALLCMHSECRLVVYYSKTTWLVLIIICSIICFQSHAHHHDPPKDCGTRTSQGQMKNMDHLQRRLVRRGGVVDRERRLLTRHGEGDAPAIIIIILIIIIIIIIIIIAIIIIIIILIIIIIIIVSLIPLHATADHFVCHARCCVDKHSTKFLNASMPVSCHKTCAGQRQ